MIPGTVKYASVTTPVCNIQARNRRMFSVWYTQRTSQMTNERNKELLILKKLHHSELGGRTAKARYLAFRRRWLEYRLG
jgi:hypothetical protein